MQRGRKGSKEVTTIKVKIVYMYLDASEEEEEGPAEQDAQIMRNRLIITADQLANALLQAQQVLVNRF
jgi:hypothetical protein